MILHQQAINWSSYSYFIFSLAFGSCTLIDPTFKTSSSYNSHADSLSAYDETACHLRPPQNINRTLASDWSCSNWNMSKKIGNLSPDYITEASGIGISGMDGQRLYLIEDGGKKTRFYVSQLSGLDMQEVEVIDSTGEESNLPIDVEDMAMGPCGSDKPCLFIGNIGNNKLNQKAWQISIVEEKKEYDDTVMSYKTIHLTIPGNTNKNAEALGVHPVTGDIFIITKEGSNIDKNIRNRKVPPASIYRIKRRDWEAARDMPMVMEKIGELNMYTLVSDMDARKQLISSMSVAPDGKSFVVLTYHDAYEFFYDLSQVNALVNVNEMVGGKDYRLVSLKQLDQQEGITYRVDPKNSLWSLIYTTEFKESDAPVMQVPCFN